MKPRTQSEQIEGSDRPQGAALPRETGRALAESMVDQYADDHYRYARQRVRDDSAAEDVVQETFVAVIERVEKFEGRSGLRTWLIWILRHKIVDNWRQLSRDGALAEDRAVEGLFNEREMWRKAPGRWQLRPEEAAENEEFKQVLDECLDHLPAQARSAFTLRVMDGEDGAEVCKALRISSTNLWVLLHRARLRLRECLERNWFVKD